MASEKRDKQVSVAVTEKELERWREAASRTVYKNLSALIRETMNQTVNIIEQFNDDDMGLVFSLDKYEDDSI